MKRLAAWSVCLFLLFPLFGLAEGFSLFPSGPEESARRSVPAKRLELFGPDAKAQSAAPVQANSGTQLKPPPKQRPHMIELSMANWRPLTRSEKFGLFSHDLLHWETHLSLAFDAGLSFATKDRQYLGVGARGYFTRYGLNVADEANFTFFNTFLFPTIFAEDPRYIPHDGYKTSARLAYALTRGILTRNDSGASEVNWAKLLGMLVATSVSSIMYSSYGADVGVGGNFVAFGSNMGSEAAFNVFKEFWPDVARKMKLSLWLRNIVRSQLRDYVRVS